MSEWAPVVQTFLCVAFLAVVLGYGRTRVAAIADAIRTRIADGSGAKAAGVGNISVELEAWNSALRLTVWVAVFALLVGGCGRGVPGDEHGVAVRSGGVLVVAAPGAIPGGSKIDVSRDATPSPLSDIDIQGIVGLGKAVKITIDNGTVQPASPLTVTVNVGDIEVRDGSVVGFILRSDDGTTEFLMGSHNAESGSIVADVPHLSWIWPVKVDLGAIASTAWTWLVESTGIKSPRPDCVGHEPQVGGRRYTVARQSNQAWVCLSAADGHLTVDVTANSPVPFKIRSAPKPASVSPLTDLGNQSTVGVALVRTLGLVKSDQGVIGRGVGSRMVYDASNSITLGFRSEPALLLLQILIGALEPILDARKIETLTKAGCFHDVVSTAQNTSLTVSAAADLTTAFLSCAGEFVELTPAGSIVLAILAAAPAALAGSLMGVIGEFTGDSKFVVKIDAESVPMTERIIIDPFTRAGELKPGWTVDTEQQGTAVECFSMYPSAFAAGPGTYACGTTADSTAACWVLPNQDHLTCLRTLASPDRQELFTRGFIVRDGFRVTGAPEGPRPVYLELADGSRWTARLGGAWGGREDGWNAAYGCINRVGVCSGADQDPTPVVLEKAGPVVDNTKASWTVRVGPVGWPPIKNPKKPAEMTVTKAWFIAGHDW